MSQSSSDPLSVSSIASAKVPHGHWKTLTLVSACRVDGVTAPHVIDGAMDSPAFLAYVEQVLVPMLKKRDEVFMNNIRRMVRQVQARDG